MPQKKKKSEKATESTFTVDRIDQLQAISSPIRQQLFEHFADQPSTTKQAAIALGYQPTRLYHLLQKLESSGLIRLVETKAVRGATEKYYDAVAPRLYIDHAALGHETAATKLSVVDGLWKNIRSDIGQLIDSDDDLSGTEEQIVFAQLAIEIDAEKQGEFNKRMTKVLEDIDGLSVKKRAGKKRQKIKVIVGWYPEP